MSRTLCLTQLVQFVRLVLTASNPRAGSALSGWAYWRIETSSAPNMELDASPHGTREGSQKKA